MHTPMMPKAEDYRDPFTAYACVYQLNQTEMGRLFDVAQTTISRWRVGSMPSDEHLDRIAAVMQVDRNLLADRINWPTIAKIIIYRLRDIAT